MWAPHVGVVVWDPLQVKGLPVDLPVPPGCNRTSPGHMSVWFSYIHPEVIRCPYLYSYLSILPGKISTFYSPKYYLCTYYTFDEFNFDHIPG